MSEFDYAGRVAIGQYLPTGSPLHRLDPRIKLGMTLLWMAAIVVAGSISGLTLATAVVAAGFAIARVPIRLALRSIRSALPFLLLLALLQVFVMPQYRTGSVIWRVWRLTVTTGGIYAGIVLLLRFAALILTISLLSFTTAINELLHGTEAVLRPLQRLGLPAHELALALGIAVRSVPLLAQEAERIAKAQASRGGDLRGGGNVLQRTRRVLPLIVPLFLAALQRAERLALAMEARGYMGGAGRTHLIALRARPADWLALAAALAGAALVVMMRW